MIVELKLNNELMELVEIMAERLGLSVPEFIQNSLESAAIEAHKDFIYAQVLETAKGLGD